MRTVKIITTITTTLMALFIVAVLVLVNMELMQGNRTRLLVNRVYAFRIVEDWYSKGLCSDNCYSNVTISALQSIFGREGIEDMKLFTNENSTITIDFGDIKRKCIFAPIAPSGYAVTNAQIWHSVSNDMSRRYFFLHVKSPVIFDNSETYELAIDHGYWLTRGDSQISWYYQCELSALTDEERKREVQYRNENHLPELPDNAFASLSNQPPREPSGGRPNLLTY